MPMKMTKRTEIPLRAMLWVVAVICLSSCGANENILRSGRETPAQTRDEQEKTPVAKEIEAMRTAGFTFIYLLRRVDAGKIDPEDKNVIKARTINTNRRVAADEDRAVIIGSNSPLATSDLASLQSKFVLENYSQPESSDKNGNVQMTR